MDPDRKKILSIAASLRPDAVRMLRAITEFAELPLREVRTSEMLSGFLAERGFRVRRGIAGMATAFRAEYVFGPGRPAVALLCEMDALQGLGHACGHNLGGVASALARVKACARGAAKAAGCRLRMEEGPYPLAAMKANPVLADSYRRALAALELRESGAPTDRNRGSSDIGNVSRVVPTLQPNVPISAGGRVEIHTRSFLAATTTPAGVAGMMEGVKALALTACDLFASPALVREAWKAFRAPDSPAR